METKKTWDPPEVIKSWTEEQLDHLMDNDELLAHGASLIYVNCSSTVISGVFSTDWCKGAK